MGGVSGLLKKLEVKPNDDEYEAIETSRWGNRDVYPVAHDKRTYGIYAYVSYWGKFCWAVQSSMQSDLVDRHMRYLSLIMDDWEFSHRHRPHGRSSNDGCHYWHAHRLDYCVP
jgi:hypothetical protein